jgi:uncharacterized membrane protein
MLRRRRKSRAAADLAAAPSAGGPPAGGPAAVVELPRDSERLEAFSDSVFGFAATLLVVTLEVPRTFPQLAESLWGFVPFAMSFLALCLLWTTHRAFFKRYQIADRPTIALNSILLFVVLFYIYPLKFMTVALVTEVLSRKPFRESTMFRGPEDVGGMFVVYSLGFAAVFACYALMYRHAARSAGELGLDAARLAEARMLSRHYWILAAVGVASIASAALGIGVRYGFPGWIYGAIGPLTWLHGRWTDRREAAAAPA